MDLNSLWFVLLGVLLAGYAILDGFDLGVGILHPFVARTDAERRVTLNAIGPLWDGNEVWLVTFSGALFAAFPEAYATVFSGFYLVFMLVLAALIGRAVSIEFRGKARSPFWRRYRDWSFCLSSLVATLLFGVGVGNAMIGVPLTARGIYAGGFFNLLTPYTLMVGLLSVAMFVMHGAIFLHLKTEGDLHERLRGWMWRGFGLFLVCYLLVTIMTLVEMPHATAKLRQWPWAWVVVVLNVLAIANIPRALHGRSAGYAFVSSCAVIAAFVLLLGLALYPNLVAAQPEPANSLNIYNAASSPRTLGIMAVIAALGMPFVLSYTAVIYWLFRGKVQIGEHSY